MNLRYLIVLLAAVALAAAPTTRAAAPAKKDPPKKQVPDKEKDKAKDDAGEGEKQDDKDDKSDPSGNEEKPKPTTGKSPTTGRSPTTKKAGGAVELPPPLTDAIADLKKEFDSHAKDPEIALRDECNYFKDKSSDVLTPEVILAALDKPLGGKPKEDAYVKWQLLSALSGKFDDKLMGRAVTIYKKSHDPGARMGASPQQQEKLTGMLKSLQKPDNKQIEEFNKEYDKLVFKQQDAEMPLLKYRDEMFEHLPIGIDSLKAGFDDASHRIGSGAEFEDHLDHVCTAARSWALSDAKPAQLSQMAAAVASLRKMKGPSWFTKAEVKSNVASWVKKDPEEYLKQLDDVITLFQERAKEPKGGLKFKEGNSKTDRRS